MNKRNLSSLKIFVLVLLLCAVFGMRSTLTNSRKPFPQLKLNGVTLSQHSAGDVIQRWGAPSDRYASEDKEALKWGSGTRCYVDSRGRVIALIGYRLDSDRETYVAKGSSRSSVERLLGPPTAAKLGESWLLYDLEDRSRLAIEFVDHKVHEIRYMPSLKETTSRSNAQ